MWENDTGTPSPGAWELVFNVHSIILGTYLGLDSDLHHGVGEATKFTAVGSETAPPPPFGGGGDGNQQCHQPEWGFRPCWWWRCVEISTSLGV